MRLHLSYIIGLPFIKALVKNHRKQQQTGSQSLDQLLIEPSFRPVLLGFLPGLALGLNLYLLFPTNEDTCVGTNGDTNMSLTPLPQSSSIVTTPVLQS